jgi:hypothetical protein
MKIEKIRDDYIIIKGKSKWEQGLAMYFANHIDPEFVGIVEVHTPYNDQPIEFFISKNGIEELCNS